MANRYNEIEWLEPWKAIAADRQAYFAAELRAEVSHKHPLYGVEAQSIARRIDCDDVLFHLRDGARPFAVVHLTYGGREEDPRWPTIQFFDSLGDWINN
jgi:hypothetical protein